MRNNFSHFWVVSCLRLLGSLSFYRGGNWSPQTCPRLSSWVWQRQGPPQSRTHLPLKAAHSHSEWPFLKHALLWTRFHRNTKMLFSLFTLIFSRVYSWLFQMLQDMSYHRQKQIGESGRLLLMVDWKKQNNTILLICFVLENIIFH